MRQLSTFTFLSLDGYYAGPAGDISWHQHDEEGAELSQANLSARNILLFGRKTYEMMQQFWPTPAAKKMFPAVAAGMNSAEKIVFSHTLTKANWANTTVVTSDAVKALQKLKKSAGKNLTVLGSGSLVTQLAQAGLIDEYQILLDPIAIGQGMPLFAGVKHPVPLQLVSSRAFKHGQMFLVYRPAGSRTK